ncbi:MAG: hypothetical protein HQL32_15545 [Planctomycetes bacterium]|nr:hypothetical protein [Planctomycetota bacterium]
MFHKFHKGQYISRDVGDEVEFSAETNPPSTSTDNFYNLVSISSSTGTETSAYSTSTGKVKYKFDSVSTLQNIYKGVTATCGSSEVALNVGVVGVKEISVGTGTSKIISTTDSPGASETYYVEKGSGSVTVTAKHDPSIVVSWPTGKPTWSSGVTPGSGSSINTATFPITTVSSTSSGTTVRATCGTSKKALKIVVVDVNVENILFNHNRTSSTNDALNIRENYSTALSLPEFSKGGSNNPSAYIKGSSVTILARLSVKPNTITSAKIKAISTDTNGSLGDLAEKSVTFNSGISQEGSDDTSTSGINESEYVEFDVQGALPSKVFTSTESWKWVVTEIDGNAVSGELEVDSTSGHEVYVLWDTPKAPWTQTVNDAMNPWVSALEYAVVTSGADGETTEDDAMSAITNSQNSAKSYIGSSQYYSFSGGTWSFTNFMTGTDGNCLDFAVALDATASVIGMSVAAKRKTDFYGYNFHCFTRKSTYVYDSCPGVLNIKTAYSSYISAGSPASTSVESPETHSIR